MQADSLRLTRKPNAQAIKVEDLLLRVQEGGVRIPLFQRPLRWRSNHVIDLFDSVARGMPIGVLLFAQEPRGAEVVRLGPVMIPARAQHDAWLVVDGQQRVAALVGALLHPQSEPIGDMHAIWYDLASETFVRRTKTDIEPTWIPMNVVGDSAKLLTWLSAWSPGREQRDLLDRAIALSKAIREYNIPSYVVAEASDGVLRLIFNRINTSGVGMRDSEVFHALHGSAEESPQAACDRLAGTGFGPLNPDLFVRCLQVVEGLPLRKGIAEADRVATGSMARTELALGRAIGFLMNDAGIAHTQMLPYRLPLIVLTRLFHLHPELDCRDRLRLRWWLWRGLLSGEHADSNNATIKSYMDALTSSPSASIDALLSLVGRGAKAVALSDVWTTRSAAAALTASAMLALGPLRLDTGLPWDDEQLRAYLAGGDHDARADVDNAATRQRTLGHLLCDAFRRKEGPLASLLLTPRRSTKPDLDQWPDRVLESHHLSRTAVEAWRRGDELTFDRERRRMIEPHVVRFWAERAGIGENERPGIAAIMTAALGVNGHG